MRKLCLLIIFLFLCFGFTAGPTTGIRNIPNHNLADQGNNVGRSVKNIIDQIDPNRKATLVFAHESGYLDEDTTYCFVTNEVIPSNITVKVEPGAIIDVTDCTVTINGYFEAGLHQCILLHGDASVDFGDGFVQEVYPQWWGAKADGVTDDTIASRKALNTGKKVRFVDGTYLISDVLEIKTTGQNVVGEGYNSILQLDANSNCDILNVWGFVSGVHSSAFRVNILDLHLDGDGSNQTSESNGISLDGYNHFCHIERVFINDIRDAGITFTSSDYTCNQNYINAYIDGGTTGLHLRRGSGNRIMYGMYQDLTGVGVEIGQGWQNVVEGNWLENNDGIKTLYANTQGTIINNNFIANWTSAGIYLNTCRGTNIENNFFEYSGTVPQTCIVVNNAHYFTVKNQDTYNNTGSIFLAFDRGVHMDCSSLNTNVKFNDLNSLYYNMHSDVSTSGTGEDDLRTSTISGDAMDDTGGIKIIAGGTKTGSNGNKTIKLYFGSNTFTVFPAANDELDWYMTAYIANANSSTSQRVYWSFTNGTSISSDWTTASATTTSDVTVKMTGECVDPNDTIMQKMFVVEFINQEP